MYKKESILWIISIFILLSSCYDENSTFGSNQVESVFRNVKTDTSTVLVTLMKIDSLETSGMSTIMAGRYVHPTWGTITASSYLPYSAPSYTTDESYVVRFDSLMLKLDLGHHYIGDTTQYYTLYIHELEKKVELNDKGYLYNTNTFPYHETPMASVSFRPRPNVDASIEVRLDDALGQDLLTRLHNRDAIVTSSTRFEDYFKGLVLIPDEENTSLLTYGLNDTTSVMVLHYHVVSSINEPKTLNISVKSSNQFNNFYHDETGSTLEGIEMVDGEISSTELGDRGLLFGGVGWYCKLEFPYLNNILEEGEQAEIESAYLKFYPEFDTYSEFNPLPDSVYLYIADENNVVTNAVMDYLGSEVQGVTLVENKQFPHLTYYYFDVTDFIQQELGAVGSNKNNLQLVFDSNTYTKTFKNLTFGDKNARYPLTLEITYKLYESY